MKKSNEELINKFHKEKSTEFPDISLEQAKEIIHGPWNFLKKEMENGELSEVRFKYFGTFQVYPGRAIHLLNNLKERFRFNKIEKSEFFKIKNMLETFMGKHGV